MDNQTYIKTEFDSGVATITLSRPEKRNALKRDFIQELNDAVDHARSQSSLRVLKIQAEGSVFCAGMDLGEMQQRAESEAGKLEWQRDSEIYAELLEKLYNLSVPTIAVLQGPVLAGGVGMVLACDFIVAAEESFLMLPEPMRGITAAMVTPFLIARVGVGPANHLLLSGERMPATRAHDLGMVYDVVSASELGSRVDQLVKTIMSGSVSALAITKQHVRDCFSEDLKSLVQKSITGSAEARETADAREGLDAFLQKRKPNWQSE